ncbi:uncharacterized protein DSM5745_01887 [Aspergillus mulundensis]|uniref:Uncharacterized protein n=1 Tax=Aspergillus mulundensis TaxID=1810919 RepID=A0A3D8SUW7_9EURO|nr:hypothetical protein DSM5745_01886 [Aspergillus mulundensis]XP_026607066.1 hypothetical protein DSM5745_01887 [Aspergillus mulundensis]RDW90111.1 hypothetical protein DSM5745_01886 [Aspergillus mulundensis]RDW90112.1 hypothetical protein DSM5745_01887 [Aspergillus mulundensis]
MYTYTPTSKFLVLAPIQSPPLAATNEQTETNATSVPRLPAGFLFLGYDHPRAASPSV